MGGNKFEKIVENDFELIKKNKISINELGREGIYRKKMRQQIKKNKKIKKLAVEASNGNQTVGPNVQKIFEKKIKKKLDGTVCFIRNSFSVDSRTQLTCQHPDLKE